MACRIITSDLAFSYDDTRSCTIAISAGACQISVRIGLEPLSILLLTSRNLLSCCSWPFSVRSWLTTLIASATMLALSFFGVLPGSSALASSMKLQVGVGGYQRRTAAHTEVPQLEMRSSDLSFSLSRL